MKHQLNREVVRTRSNSAKRWFSCLCLVFLTCARRGNTQHDSGTLESTRRLHSQVKNSTFQAITHATVIDPVSGVEQPDRTILIHGSEIVFVGPSAQAQIPPGSAIHDATGRYVIPGLWDSHVHLTQTGPRDFPLFVENGITSVRDMGSVLKDIRRWQAQRAAGAPIPRIISPGPKLDGMSPAQSRRAPFLPDRFIVTSPEAARAEVAHLKAEHVDFIKVHQGMTPIIYRAIVDESRIVGLPFEGHLPIAGPIVAAKAGQRTIEHGVSNGAVGMLMCSPEILERIRMDPAVLRYANFCAPLAMQSKIFSALVKARAWFTPTLVSGRGHLVGTPMIKTWKEFSGSSEVWPALQQHWDDPLFADTPAPEFERYLIGQFSALTAAASRAGVHLLAGTDLGDPYIIPGYALHDELELMVKAGVPTLTALQSATSEPARAFGFEGTVGSVTRGRAADLVVLDADPLADIANTRRIRAVVLNGRWIKHEASD